MKFDVIISGVGGQGNVLASRILAQAAINAGHPVRTSEAIGMAQREGVVMSQVRIGEDVYSPIIPEGEGDVLLGLELAETVRMLPRVKKNCTVVANTACIIPVSATLGMAPYDENTLINYLKQHAPNLHLLDASNLAAKAGNVKVANVVLLGAVAALKILPFSGQQLLDTVINAVPIKFKDVNRRAFELGYQSLEV
ncbi:indolepyruvate oxidoreductase subunit beta [Desulfofalx alkaliphila]|uniref:indolepyruvate oxidoreductase subunit beta n=1 Tax=Desulfofalx alkaliphila TaxID=105483 RepID=UPI0004E18A56|nr:indolepyruvate oxidoreductase subunit beta [Desulfofalx alkaliphila]